MGLAPADGSQAVDGSDPLQIAADVLFEMGRVDRPGAVADREIPDQKVCAVTHSLGQRGLPDTSPRIDRQSRLAGFVAGEGGKPSYLCWAEHDVCSWRSGWVEGDAKRQGHKYSLGTLTQADVDEYKASKLNPPPGGEI